MLDTFVEAQQERANIVVAKMLHKEYPKESFEFVLNMVRQGKVSEYPNV